MGLLQWLCFFLERIAPDQVYSEPGYFFFDEETGDIHRL